MSDITDLDSFSITVNFNEILWIWCAVEHDDPLMISKGSLGWLERVKFGGALFLLQKDIVKNIKNVLVG